MRWALVTGAGQRLGRAVALGLAQAHWGVVLHYRGSAPEAEHAATLARAHSGGAVTVKADLNDPAERAALIAHATEKAGAPLVGLVNCAAMFEHDVIDTATEESLQRHMKLNAYTPVVLAREFAEALPDGAAGAVVNFLDFKLASPYPDHFSYTLSKYALSGATDLLARALAPRVRVNAVAPGYVLPAPGQAEADWKRLHDQTPLKRGPTPEDIASAARFLLENQAVTGQTIYVDGGRRFDSFERDMEFM
jgi:NAD(P)-dependent dehydrogenase (short-subunit alcohol dehydrogenase family)